GCMESRRRGGADNFVQVESGTLVFCGNEKFKGFEITRCEGLIFKNAGLGYAEIYFTYGRTCFCPASCPGQIMATCRAGSYRLVHTLQRGGSLLGGRQH